METVGFSVKLGERVRAARKVAKLNGQQLAAKIEMSQSYISEIERGNRNPSLPTLLRIAKVLNCPVSYFLQDLDPDEDHSETRTELEVRIGIQFGTYLSNLLAEKNIHPVHFCQLVGIDLSDLRQLSLGFLPPRRTVEKMAEVLEVDSFPLLWRAGYVPTPCLDPRYGELLADDKLRTVASKLADNLSDEELKDYILQVISAATRTVFATEA